jgi:hypothetical protein
MRNWIVGIDGGNFSGKGDLAFDRLRQVEIEERNC